MRTGKTLAIFGLIASTFAVFVKIMTPTNVLFIFDGNTIELNMIPEIYTSFDMSVIGISGFIMGSSLVYLWLIDKNQSAPNEQLSSKKKWNKLLIWAFGWLRKLKRHVNRWENYYAASTCCGCNRVSWEIPGTGM